MNYFFKVTYGGLFATSLDLFFVTFIGQSVGEFSWSHYLKTGGFVAAPESLFTPVSPAMSAI